MSIEAKRTPDHRFENLPGFSFAPHYVDDLKGYEGLRVHYLDEGPRDAAQTFLCLHGQPTWSYLYRKMLPVFVDSGARVICPDWLGFGRSDKPVEDGRYTFHFHRNMMIALIKKLDLNNITLVCQDWGGILGLTIPMEMPERFARLLVMNTAIPVGQSPGEGFEAWRAFNRTQPDMDIAALMQRATPILSQAEAEAYAAPFPDIDHKAGVRRFPELVMTDPSMEGVETSKRAAAWWRSEWHGESFMAVGVQDPVLGPNQMQSLRATIANCPEPMMIEDGGHFVQEWGEPIARAALQRWGDLS
ncbi:MAG: haloalkane dehalogenase [Hyphomonadaceae bacterium]|nr:haloalkane dehalogenase [Hyphomonadaceae bacterium]